MNNNTIERFTKTVKNYLKSRPSYPQAVWICLRANVAKLDKVAINAFFSEHL
jgi:hypothetical protein